ncbi:hypothetical protein ZYGM_000337 [Zygosaccharomyces mellis]|uniref:Uncharacterized protein n=1 Tax=Zygosaccharomyces mellis TaxID=42258 RepID=A0A4C2E5I0_9SACH|nr:hypothetical protein ZYGM_000337 [Zygosaccharomyces mellis]
MIPFEEGYNRRNCIQEPDWNAIEPDMWAQQQKRITKPNTKKTAEESSEHSDLITSVASTDTSASTGPTAYMPLHDSRNQLSSLVKNAQNNKEALEQRNQWIKQSNMKSRKEYGW